MTAETYMTLTWVLGIGMCVALVMAAFSFGAMLVRWKTLRRRRHAIGLLVSLAAVPLLVGLQQLLLWQIYLPAWGRQQMAEIKKLARSNWPSRRWSTSAMRVPNSR